MKVRDHISKPRHLLNIIRYQKIIIVFQFIKENESGIRLILLPTFLIGCSFPIQNIVSELANTLIMLSEIFCL